jgi:uncharacterized protein (DUF2141 family)
MVQKRNHCWSIDVVAVQSHDAEEVVDGGKKLPLGKYVVASVRDEEANSKLARALKILPPLSHTGSQETGF